MKALISSIEHRETGYRVAQVESDEKTFPVAEGLFWIDCSADVVADQFWFDPIDQTIKPNPEPVVITNNATQPTSQGTQTL